MVCSHTTKLEHAYSITKFKFIIYFSHSLIRMRTLTCQYSSISIRQNILQEDRAYHLILDIINTTILQGDGNLNRVFTSYLLNKFRRFRWFQHLGWKGKNGRNSIWSYFVSLFYLFPFALVFSFTNTIFIYKSSIKFEFIALECSWHVQNVHTFPQQCLS